MTARANDDDWLHILCRLDPNNTEEETLVHVQTAKSEFIKEAAFAADVCHLMPDTESIRNVINTEVLWVYESVEVCDGGIYVTVNCDNVNTKSCYNKAISMIVEALPQLDGRNGCINFGLPIKFHPTEIEPLLAVLDTLN